MLRIVCVVAAGMCAWAPAAAANITCPPPDFESIKNFDLDAYAANRWYIQEMMVTNYLPKSQNWCVFAEYKRLAKKSFWGYDLHVHNHAEEQDGTVHDSDGKGGPPGGGIDAKIVNGQRGQLAVAPSFLPTSAAGPYWVLAYNETAGYSLISGGPPTVQGSGGCRTGSGTNNAGLWIFTRMAQPPAGVVSAVRAIAEAKGFDLSVLNPVDHSNCTHDPPGQGQATSFEVVV